MNAVAVPPVRTPLRKRLAELLNATADGLWSGMHEKCLADTSGRCPACAQSVAPACAQAVADTETIDAGIASVTGAATEAAAIGAYFDCYAALGGLGVAVESVAMGGAR